MKKKPNAQTIDQRLRTWCYTIYCRPKDGPNLWKSSLGEVMDEMTALRRIEAAEQELKQSKE